MTKIKSTRRGWWGDKSCGSFTVTWALGTDCLGSNSDSTIFLLYGTVIATQFAHLENGDNKCSHYTWSFWFFVCLLACFLGLRDMEVPRLGV